MSHVVLAPSFLAQQAPPGGGFDVRMLGFYALLFAAMYFLMIAPQRKKQKEHAKMLDALTTGDTVITSGGIYGEITNKKEDSYIIRIAEGTKIEVGKAFIHALVKKSN
jgi:preprotein translocase subunit YajC